MSAMLADVAQLHVLRPWWLLALLLLPLLAWRLRAQALRRSAWRDAVDAHLLPHLLEGEERAARRGWTRRLGLLGLALAILAMAGPSFRKDEQPLWQSRQPLVVALDLSRATLARDLPPNRLAQARAKLAMLLRERIGGQVALVAFADDAYTVAPLTDDAANVALFLDALSPDVMPADGQRADRAIAWSQTLLRQAGFAHGDILLLTDHADAAAIAAAANARAAGYEVSALGLGTAQGGVFDAPTGQGQARLDAASLRALAGSGGGRYRAIAAGDDDLRALGVLDPRQDDGVSARGETVARWRDDGYWLLPLALLCFLPLFRRGALAVVLACVLWLPQLPARAQSRDVPASSLWQRADQAEYARMQEGIAAYRSKNYEGAIERFSTVDGAEGQYNLGNALAQAGRYDDAIAAYDRALKQRPGMADAAYNRAQVEAAKKRQQQQQQDGQKNPQQDPQKKQQQDQQKDQQSGDQDNQAQRQQDGKQGEQRQRPQQPSQSDARDAPQKSGKPEDGQAQQQADAAQRQRMQDALKRQQGKEEPQAQPDAGKPQETAEQRERRLANQAWLQRVPDDPGALLRARFQLEARRRQGGGNP